MLQRRGRHTHARVPSDGLGLWDKHVSVGETWWFSEHLRVCEHDCKHVFRTGTEYGRYRVIVNMF